eukprot:m.89524 g.89524  ORF g.89524 m.89524 type:complete len:244 (-) comp13226_c0_seq5:1435-2166(-)
MTYQDVSFFLFVTCTMWQHQAALENDIIKALRENSEWSTFLSWLNKTDTINVLQSEGMNYTVFAPTNTAIASLNMNLSTYISSQPALRQEIVLYHIVPDTVLRASDLVFGRISFTVEGSTLTYSRRRRGFRYITEVISGGDIGTRASVSVGATGLRNGIIHKVNKVLIPESALLVAQYGMESIIQELESAILLTFTQLLKKVAVIFDSRGINKLRGLMHGNASTMHTIFAPLDNAFFDNAFKT